MGNDGIGGLGGMYLAQLLYREAIGEPPRIPHFKTVAEEHHLNTAVAGVVAVGHGIGNGLGNGTLRQLIFHRGISGLVSCSHPGIDTRHHKPYGLVDHLEEGAGEDLIVADGLLHLRAVELCATHFRGAEEPLRVLGKEQQG